MNCHFNRGALLSRSRYADDNLVTICVFDGLASLNSKRPLPPEEERDLRETLEDVIGKGGKLLVRKKIFTTQTLSSGVETLYGLPSSSKWLLHDAETSLAPMRHPWQLAPWHCLSLIVEEGGVAYGKAHGCGIWDFVAQNPEFNEIFNDAMTCSANITIEVVGGYEDGFGRFGSLVDVGGGNGNAMAAVARAFPQINLDSYKFN
ncbi:O-methyltransferase domain [Dillenia turbinata]|uniref:O-methyltransferase domain n=1 Tax=Dillenia turbinata TaxID=194707 RepID=A0AAN8VQD5_9MAGN